MEGNLVLSSAQQRKSGKKSKAQKKPVKVVYISNPMKVKTCASKFRSLVQELTGQDADWPDASKFPAAVKGSSCGGPSGQKKTDGGDYVGRGVHNGADGDGYPVHEPSESSGSRCEPSDDVFVPQMIEDFPLLFEPSGSQVDLLIGSFDNM